MEVLEADIVATGAVLVVIDTFQRMAKTKQGNEYAEVTADMDPYIHLAQKTGAHILLIHHAGKGDRADPVDAVLGSTGYAASGRGP